MADASTVFVSGKIYWAKIIGAPRTNYEGTGREWAYEFEPDDVTFLKEHKLLDRLKDKYSDEGRGDYITLRKPEFTSQGEKNEPIRIYDGDNQAWDTNKLLGNGTKVDAKLRIVDWGKGKKKSIYTLALRVTDLVPYVSNEFGGMDAAAPKTKTKPKATAVVDELDDDIPFE